MLIDAGCLNGGGQIKPISGQSAKGLSQLLESVYMENVSIILDLLDFQVLLPFFKSMTCLGAVKFRAMLRLIMFIFGFKMFPVFIFIGKTVP